MDHDQYQQQELTKELELHQIVKKARLQVAIHILVEGEGGKDYDDKQSVAAWKHMTEASKQQGLADKINRKAARTMKKELEKMIGSTKEEEEEEKETIQKRTDHHRPEKKRHRRSQLH